MRRFASMDNPAALDLLVKELRRCSDDERRQVLILRNMLIGFKGRGQVAKPAGWDALVEKDKFFSSTDLELRSTAFSLAVVFGDARAFKHMREELASTKTDLPSRQAALTALLDARDKELCARPAPARRRKGAARRRHPCAGGLRRSKNAGSDSGRFRLSHRRGKARRPEHAGRARPAYGKALMDAVAAKKVAANDVPADVDPPTPQPERQGPRQPHRRGLGHRPHDAGRSRQAHRRLEEEAEPHRAAAGPGAGPGDVRQDVPAVPHALRRRRQGRPGHHRLQSRQPRLPAGKHHRPQRRHPQRLQGDASSLCKSGRVITGIVRGETPMRSRW